MEEIKTAKTDMYEVFIFLVGLLFYLWGAFGRHESNYFLILLGCGFCLVAFASYSSKEKYGVLFTIARFKFTKKTLEFLIVISSLFLVYFLSNYLIKSRFWIDFVMFAFCCIYSGIGKWLKLQN